MRIIVLATAGLLASAAPAGASMLGTGPELAESCYQAAQARDTSTWKMSACTKALEQAALEPREIVRTHVNRGILFLASGNLRAANRDFDEALHLDPKYPEAWLNKALAQLQGGDSKAALAHADKALEFGTAKPAAAYYVRGLAKEGAGDVRGAFADLQKAAALAPEWKEPTVELARFKVASR
jgi:tetratricopeptide (TPR) repeat protein